MPEVHRPYWFPAKRYGWGWGLPATWQGWVVVIAWLAIIIGVSPLLTAHHFPLFFVFMGAMAVLLIAICYAKGEPPRWRWG
ncbi:MAG: hypothetical protein ABSG31_17965 [Tepidisphaeraceae bacterium]|jgi:hypothetical protein